jgi:tetratricopeptide (TPR) repeat protein
MKNQGYIWGGVIAVILIGGAVLVFHARQASAPSSMASSTSAGTTTAVDLGGGLIAHLPAGTTITEAPTNSSNNTVKAPSLNQSVTYSADLSSDAVAILKSNIATLSASLKSNPSQSDEWLQLAIYYKTAGDYTLAEQVWLYLTKAAPSNSVAFADLGDLYNSFIVNYPKAETYYLQAIKLKPDDINTYNNLFLMYRYQYKTNTTAAADLLTQGLKANPNAATLLQLQSQLK